MRCGYFAYSSEITIIRCFFANAHYWLIPECFIFQSLVSDTFILCIIISVSNINYGIRLLQHTTCMYCILINFILHLHHARSMWRASLRIAWRAWAQWSLLFSIQFNLKPAFFNHLWNLLGIGNSLCNSSGSTIVFKRSVFSLSVEVGIYLHNLGGAPGSPG